MKVSIIIPTYNRAHYLDAALKSVMQQEYSDLEIIVVDDGSTDGTSGVINAYTSDSRVVYVYQDNSGKPSIARNHGLLLATGELICFLDSDDLLLPCSIVKRVSAFLKHEDLALLCSSLVHFKDFDQVDYSWNTIQRDRQWIASLPLGCVVSTYGTLTLFGRNVAFEFFDSNAIFTSTVMMRRSVFAKVGNFDEKLTICEDYDLWMRIACCHGTGFILEPLAMIRQHAGHITFDKRANMVQDEMVLRKFLASPDRPTPVDLQRERKKIALFFTECACYHYFRNDFPGARQYFRKAFAWKFSLSLLTYFLVSCLPAPVAATLRTLCARMRGRGAAPRTEEGIRTVERG